MNRRHKVLITKICLVLMWGILGYFVVKYIYLWIRKKEGKTGEIDLAYVLLVSFLFDVSLLLLNLLSAIV